MATARPIAGDPANSLNQSAVSLPGSSEPVLANCGSATTLPVPITCEGGALDHTLLRKWSSRLSHTSAMGRVSSCRKMLFSMRLVGCWPSRISRSACPSLLAKV